MDTSVIERIPVASLFPDRYGMGKTKIYSFLKALEIERVHEGKEAFISLENLQDLDAYVAFYRNGDRLSIKALLQRRSERVQSPRESVHEPVYESVRVESEPFRESVRESVREPVQAEFDSAIVQQVSQSPSWLVLVDAIAQRVRVQQPVDPLLPQIQLEKAWERRWVLTTDQVRSIIGTKPRGDRFERLGFVLVRVGRCGAQAGWAVEKREPSEALGQKNRQGL